MAPVLLEVEDLRVCAGGAEVLRGIGLRVAAGEVHAVIGPAGKVVSALAGAVAGHPALRAIGGRVCFHGEDVTAWSAEIRAKAGMFVAFGQPEALPGVSVAELLHQALAARRGEDVTVVDTRRALDAWAARLGVAPGVAGRPEGGSAAEAIRQELLQLAVVEADLAILDGIGPGLDGDTLAAVAASLEEIRAARPQLAVLAATKDRRVPAQLHPDTVHVLIDGRIAATGGPELALQVEGEGYEPWRST